MGFEPMRHALTDRTIAHVLADAARRNGERPFLLFEDRVLTYAEVHRLSGRLAGALATLGVGHGTHVAVVMENRPEMVLTYLALGLLRAVAVPVNTAAKGDTLAYFLGQSDTELVVADADAAGRIATVADRLPRLRAGVVVDGDPPPGWPERLLLHRYGELPDGAAPPPATAPRPSDLYMIMYTSGTTGRSKGVMIPQASVLTQAMAVAEAGGYGPDDVLYTCLPLFHANAWWCSCLPALLSDAAVAVSRRFSVSRFWDEVRQHGATQFNLLGAMATFLWKRPPGPGDRDHSVRQALVVPVPAEFHAGFEERFGIRLKSLYGLTDACITATKRDGDPASKWASAGRACDHVEIAVVDEDDRPLPPGTVGELLIRGREPWVMAQGYYNMPEATVAAWRNLWLHSGDRAFIDADGYLHFVDRKKDAIRRRGENISSFEVEQILLGHPDVLEVAAYGVDSEHGEEEVMVSVVRRPGATVGEEELIRHCDRNMPYFMVPRFVEFVGELPKNLSAKVEKYKLKAGAGERLALVWDRERAGIALRR